MTCCRTQRKGERLNPWFSDSSLGEKTDRHEKLPRDGMDAAVISEKPKCDDFGEISIQTREHTSRPRHRQLWLQVGLHRNECQGRQDTSPPPVSAPSPPAWRRSCSFGDFPGSPHHCLCCPHKTLPSWSLLIGCWPASVLRILGWSSGGAGRWLLARSCACPARAGPRSHEVFREHSPFSFHPKGPLSP